MIDSEEIDKRFIVVVELIDDLRKVIIKNEKDHKAAILLLAEEIRDLKNHSGMRLN